MFFTIIRQNKWNLNWEQICYHRIISEHHKKVNLKDEFDKQKRIKNDIVEKLTRSVCTAIIKINQN